jgi:glyoxylase-like metal-dependent hydrolase (beta-lactamase superfamily II)
MRAYGLRGTRDDGRIVEYAPDVVRLSAGVANTYLVGEPTRWVLVDTGLPGLSPLIRRTAEARFGRGARPIGIVLTHGHFDHSGNVDALARHWNVPVYAHALELQYLAGRSEYPPQDPTVGGAMAAMSRMFPHGGGRRRVETNVRVLGDLLPGMPEWRSIHTPGHTPGHISLFREADRLLLSGDALTTVNMDSWVELLRRTPVLANPPAPLTPDWESARRSIEELASLAPVAIGAGHGRPIAGDGVAAAVRRFAATFTPPSHGRYVAEPASTGPAGVEWVPPPVPDPFPRQAASAALMVLGGIGLATAGRRRRT